MTATLRRLRQWSSLASLAVLFALAGCGVRGTAPTAPFASGGPADAGLAASGERFAQALRAQERHGDLLLEVDGVVGAGVEADEAGRPLIRVYVTRTGLRLPSQLDGVPVAAEVTGEFHALSLTGRYRPIAMGVSVGNADDCIPGTIGAVLARGSRRYLLSCNHVLARQNAAVPGETIVQPARVDASEDCSPSPAADAVAVLSDYEPLDFGGGPNTYDAAIAEITLPASQIRPATLPGYYGAPGSKPVEGVEGLKVMKVGRTTELTRGRIKSIRAKIKIFYPAGVAKFTDVMMTSKDFGAFGDSGSLVVTRDETHSPVGLLFAGDDQGRGIVCPIEPILKRFDATLCTR